MCGNVISALCTLQVNIYFQTVIFINVSKFVEHFKVPIIYYTYLILVQVTDFVRGFNTLYNR